jgi:hypothetical protein
MTDLQKLGQEHRPGQLPPVGTKLTAKHAGRTYQAEIIHDKEADRPMVKLGQKVYRSLSTAASSVTGHAMNGWTFFGLKPVARAEAGARPPEPAAAPRTRRAPAKKRSAAKRGSRRSK